MPTRRSPSPALLPLLPAFLALLALATLAPAPAHADEHETLVAMLEKSKAEGKGITLFLPGHTLPIVVTEVHGEDAVEGRNQQYERVWVRLEEVLAAAFQ